MKNIAAATALTVLLTGCAQYNLTLMSQTSGKMSHGTANEAGKTITAELNGETYTGHYSFIQQGSVGFGSTFAQAFAGGASGSAFGNSTYFSQAAAGNGSALLSSPSGKGLRCQFSFSTMSNSGAGICRDDTKKLYDLQIN